MIARIIETLLRLRLKSYPAVVLVGPRQSGKTTLARSMSSSYFDLEQPTDRLRLDLGWDELVAGRQLIILDEAQNWPGLFPRLRGTIDADRRRNGRFLLLGSVSPALMKQVAESLAGRLALVELSPFLAVEQSGLPLDDFWLRGGFPNGGILTPKSFPQWQLDYLTLIAQRDLPVWGLAAKPPLTLRLMRMLAAMHGQLWNASQIGQSLGLSYHTVNNYLDYLEGAFLIRRLAPWLPNLKKRLVRSPRIYWRDSGLLHALLGVRTMDDLLNQPWVGASWEGFVLHQVLGLLAARGEAVDSYYFRTSDGYEADLVFKLGTQLWAVETQLSANPSPQDFSRFNTTSQMIGADRRYLIALVSKPSLSDTSGVLSLPDLLDLLEKEF
jgi:predicted AAA+ superfamily ATPase